ncbi:MAG: ABC transporter permease [Phototrophicaceae bacterium]
MTATTLPPEKQAVEAREPFRFRLTRTGVFSVIFILLGLGLVFWFPPRLPAGAITGVNFGENAGNATLDVPTIPYSIVVGVIWIITGIVGFIPLTALRALKSPLLIFAGILIIPTSLILAAANNSFNLAVMLGVSIRLATPIILGAMAGIWTERSGVVNIAIEGMMLMGAGIGFVAFTLAANVNIPSSGGQWLGVSAAILAGGAMALLHAWLSITFKTEQIVSGTVINILAVGVTSFLRREVLLSSEAGRETLRELPIPLLSKIPVLGEMFFQGKPIFYAMLVLVVVTHVVLFYTQWGLRTRSVGENPHAADTLGINVNRTRWINVFIGGMIAGLAGAWFSLESTGSFDDNMTNGKGFIALAAMIFGKWLPFGAAGGGVLFGFSEALGDRFQLLNVPIPPQFVQMTPYLITIIVLAGLVGRANPPKAVGVPYEKE